MRKYIPIALCIVFSLAALAIIWFISQRGFQMKNGFQRRFSLSNPKLSGALDLKYNSYYIMGVTSDSVYLGNVVAPTHFVRSSYTLTDSAHCRIKLNDDKNVNWGAAIVKLDYPDISITEHKTPSFITTNTSFNYERLHQLKDLKFDIIQVLSPNSIVIRYFDFKLKQYLLQKVIVYPDFKRLGIYKPKKQLRSDFSTDGFFSYNKTRNRLFYSFYYRNQFLCLDTNMNLLYEGKTIDTNHVAKIETVELKSSGRIEKIFSKPPFYVNKRGFTDGSVLYINSALASDTEKPEDFNNYSVIDVYEAVNGKYHHSFKLPNQFGKKLNDFAIYRKHIVALYDQYLVAYQF